MWLNRRVRGIQEWRIRAGKLRRLVDFTTFGRRKKVFPFSAESFQLLPDQPFQPPIFLYDSWAGGGGGSRKTNHLSEISLLS